MSSLLTAAPPSPLSIQSSHITQKVLRHFEVAIEAWPRDRLRPECQLSTVLAKRLEQKTISPNTAGRSDGAREKADLQQVNALLSLVENRYQTKVSRGWKRAMSRCCVVKRQSWIAADVWISSFESPTNLCNQKAIPNTTRR
jgi:hypothetical protein